MKVTVLPWAWAVILVTYLTSMVASPAATRPIMGVSISHWPGPPTSWWWYLTGTPIASRCSGHLAAQVVELVFGRDGVVAAVQGDIVTVPAGGAVPVGFVGVQAVGGMVDAVVEGDVVEDVELDIPVPTGCDRRCRSRADRLRRGWRYCAGRWRRPAWVSASRVVQMKLRVGASQNGSMKPVLRSGTSTISPALTLFKPTAEPSKPMPLP